MVGREVARYEFHGPMSGLEMAYRHSWHPKFDRMPHLDTLKRLRFASQSRNINLKVNMYRAC